MGVGIADGYEPKHQASPQQLLQEVAPLCEGMYEAQVMCDQVRRRLVAIANDLEHHSSSCSSGDAQLRQQQRWTAFDELLTRFHDFLERFVRQEVVFRLTSKRVVVRKTRAFHEVLDGFLKDAIASEGDVQEPQDEVHEWHDRFENACVNLHIVFAELSRDRMALLRDLIDLQSQQEALTLVMYEYKRPAGTYTKPELQVIQNAFNTITRFSRAKAPVVPKWFLPLHDVEFERRALTETPSATSTGVEVHRGMFNEAVVLVTFVRGDLEPQQQAAFVKAVVPWFEMSGQHPNVTRLYGASHVGELFFATESSENGTLDGFVVKNPTLLWVKLFEVAQGLQFLHEHKLVHGDVKPSSILIDGEGIAKIADNIAALLDLHDSESEAAWRRAPENLNNDENDVPTLACDVYAFGTCIEQAAKLASSLSESDTVDQFPTNPEILSKDQSIFLRQMCAELPEQRPNMAMIVEKLREFAEAEDLARQRHADDLAADARNAAVSVERRSTFDDFPANSSRRGRSKETKDQKRERKKREREDKEKRRQVWKESRQKSGHSCALQ